MNTKYDNGTSVWTHGEPVYSDGRVVGNLLGPCPRCGGITRTYGSAYSCIKDYCPNNSGSFVCRPDPEPSWWNTGVSVQMDGNAWCATREGFINLQESDAGFGDSILESVEELLREESS